MLPKITIHQAIQELLRYDCEYYTPANREAHRMAIKALREQGNLGQLVKFGYAEADSERRTE